MRPHCTTLIIGLLLIPGVVTAGEVDILDAEITARGDNHYDFKVTLKHADTGWDHYADRWEILSPDGSLIATRTLYHPHVHEQPFTRGLSDVAIPEGISTVTLRAHDKVHGYGGKTLVVELPASAH